jgi:hypothetical protein
LPTSGRRPGSAAGRELPNGARRSGRRDAEGRDPATVELTVGINIGGDDPDDPRVALDPAAIADALGEWAELGIGHVQAGVYPTVPTSFETALEGIRRFRG